MKGETQKEYGQFHVKIRLFSTLSRQNFNPQYIYQNLKTKIIIYKHNNNFVKECIGVFVNSLIIEPLNIESSLRDSIPCFSVYVKSLPEITQYTLFSDNNNINSKCTQVL